MTHQTEATFRAVLKADGGVDDAGINAALAMLNRRRKDAAAPPRILRIGDVMNLLSVSRPTVRRYVKSGHLDLFYGRERRALGVTSESFVRFTEKRSRGTDAPGTAGDAPGHKGWTRREKTRMLRSSLELKMRNMMHFDGRTTQRQKCERIDELLRQFPEASFNMGCHAAGVPRSTYANHRLRNKRDKTRYAAMRRTVIDAVSTLHPDRSEEVNISALLKQLQRKRIRIARQTLRDALHKAGYILRPRGRAWSSSNTQRAIGKIPVRKFDVTSLTYCKGKKPGKVGVT